MSYKPTVAILGGERSLVDPLLEIFSFHKEQITLPVKAITRNGHQIRSNSFIQYGEASCLGEFIIELTGVDVVISLAQELTDDIADAIVMTRPQLYIPVVCKEMMVQEKERHVQRVQSAGIKTILVDSNTFSSDGSYLFDIEELGLGATRIIPTITYTTADTVLDMDEIDQVISMMANDDVETHHDSVSVFSDKSSELEPFADHDSFQWYNDAGLFVDPKHCSGTSSPASQVVDLLMLTL